MDKRIERVYVVENLRVDKSGNVKKYKYPTIYRLKPPKLESEKVIEVNKKINKSLDERKKAIKN